MQTNRALSLLLVGAAASSVSARSKANPLGEVLSLLNDLTAKVKADGEAEAKAYKEYFEWCDDVAKNGQFSIKTATSQKESLEATISELSAEIEAAESKISDLAADISTNTADLKSATEIRTKEAADFAASEKELVESIDALGRAVTILQREMAKNPAAFNQMATGGVQGMLNSLSTVIDAAAFSVTDKQRLTALVQSQQASQDEDGSELLGAPAADVYQTHSGSIFDVLEDLKEKAEAQLSELRKAETASKHNYELLKQSLEDELAADNKGMSETKTSKAEAEQGKATAEGDLAVTVSDLKTANEALESAGSNCMSTAATHEATVKARNEELEVIAKAVEILKSTTSGAEGQTYSLLQVSTGISSHADLARSEVVALVKKLAREQHSAALAQLASRISAVVRFGAGDPFSKVKGLISDMIAKLEAEAQSEATEKAYCDEELAKTNEKSGELNDDIAKLTSKIDTAAARSAKLKKEVAELQSELADMAKAQAENDEYRQESHADYTQAKADLELGLSGVRKALDVLRDYYGAASFVQQPAVPQHEASTGSGNSIIGILEVVESDFANNLAKEETEESAEVDAYETSTQEYKISKAKKDQDVLYKTQEFKSLDKSISELSSDRQTLNSELSAVSEYLAQLKDRCIAKPETYEQRKQRRDAEIAGLKEALNILQAEAFVQRGKKARGHMRGSNVLAPGI